MSAQVQKFKIFEKSSLWVSVVWEDIYQPCMPLGRLVTLANLGKQRYWMKIQILYTSFVIIKGRNTLLLPPLYVLYGVYLDGGIYESYSKIIGLDLKKMSNPQIIKTGDFLLLLLSQLETLRLWHLPNEYNASYFITKLT